MNALAITYAAHTTVPVSWTSPAGQTVTAQMPTGLHTAYAADAHTATAVQLAEAPQQAPAMSPGGFAGLSGATLIGLGLLIWTAAKWKSSPKEVKSAFIKGVAVAVLVGSWGLFGTLAHTVKSTGDSTGATIANVGAGGQ